MLQQIGRVLNWFPGNSALTKGLRPRLAKTQEALATGETPKSFITIRLDTKWSDMLDPGDTVSVSISKDPNNPNIVGYARVKSVKKTRISELTISELRKNIGAKNRKQVLKDMKSVYKGRFIIHGEIITVIELEA